MMLLPRANWGAHPRNMAEQGGASYLDFCSADDGKPGRASDPRSGQSCSTHPHASCHRHCSLLLVGIQVASCFSGKVGRFAARIISVGRRKSLYPGRCCFDALSAKYEVISVLPRSNTQWTVRTACKSAWLRLVDRLVLLACCSKLSRMLRVSARRAGQTRAETRAISTYVLVALFEVALSRHR